MFPPPELPLRDPPMIPPINRQFGCGDGGSHERVAQGVAVGVEHCQGLLQDHPEDEGLAEHLLKVERNTKFCFQV